MNAHAMCKKGSYDDINHLNISSNLESLYEGNYNPRVEKKEAN